MARWLGHGNPAIAEALNAVCQVIDSEIRAELRQEKPLLRDASTCTTEDLGISSASAPAIIDRLEKENAQLRSELAALMASREKSMPLLQVPSAVDATPVLPGPTTNSGASELDILKCRYVALDDNFRKARKVLERKKDEVEAWAERYASLMKQVRGAEKQHGIQILRARDKDSNSRMNRVSASAAPDELPDLPPLPPPPPTGNRELPIEQSDLLQSTQGDPDEEEEELPPLPPESRHSQVVIKEEPSSDTPIVVLERAVKRRKVDSGVMDTIELELSRIKNEPDESNPVLRMIQTQESLDLDHIAQRMTTPRKRREDDDIMRHDSPSGPESPSRAPTPRSARPEPPRVDHHGPSNRGAAWSMLTPVSGNERSRRFIDGADKTPTVRNKLVRGIAELAEDGGMYGRAGFERTPKNSPAPGTIAQGRLNRLLSDPDTAENVALPDVPVTPRDQLGIPQRRELPFNQPAKQGRRHDALFNPNVGVSDPRAPVRKASPQTGKAGASTLRQRPLEDLGLDDFKINPAANQGYDFAFSEVVRNKDDRAALRGCVDMHCCGKKWRAIALSQRPDPPLTPGQRQEEQKLLEDYLGDFCHKLTSMTKEDRTELWLEAKTAELANRYGKHRHHFARRQSPPGFWNADFPDTQQLKEEREEASKRERQTVAERHREASRPGGRWLFRDE